MMQNVYDKIYIETHDISWYAVDSVGQIALFMKSLYGQLPDFVINNRDRNEFINEYFNSSECRCVSNAVIDRKQKSERAVAAGEKYNVFLAECLLIAQKGLYCYDASDDDENDTKDYGLIARPEKPINIGDLPREVAMHLTQMQLKNICFGDKKRILI